MTDYTAALIRILEPTEIASRFTWARVAALADEYRRPAAAIAPTASRRLIPTRSTAGDCAALVDSADSPGLNSGARSGKRGWCAATAGLAEVHGEMIKPAGRLVAAV